MNTCIGVLCDAREVNPTMSVNRMVTQLKLSASTGCPSFICMATDFGNILQIVLRVVLVKLEKRFSELNNSCFYK